MSPCFCHRCQLGIGTKHHAKHPVAYGVPWQPAASPEITLLTLECTQKRRKPTIYPRGLKLIDAKSPLPLLLSAETKVYEKHKAVKRRDEEQRQLHQLNAEERRFEMELRRERQRFEQSFASQQQSDQHELNWMSQLSTLNPMALVVAARDTDRAQLVREMQETDALRGMTEEQILAKMSGNSPEAARALAEIRKAAVSGQMGEEQKSLYERLLRQQEAVGDIRREEVDRMERLRRDDSLDRQAERDSMRSMIESQLRGMADIEQAKGQPAAFQPNVIVTGGGGAVSGGNSAENRTLPCPMCDHPNGLSANFCGECGNPLRGMPRTP